MPHYRMADGRAFTDYNASCSTIKHIQTTFGVQDGHSLRYFLQQNSDKVIHELKNCSGENPGETCSICPVCMKALDYKPNGN